MKTLFFISFVLGFNLMISAQPFGIAASNYQIVKMNYENSSGEKGYTVFKYNQNGTLHKALWSLNDTSRYSNNYYEHDLYGNLVSAYREFSDGLTSFELFIYDSIGNKISEQFYRSDSVSGFATYQYKDNQLIQANFKNYKGWLNGTLKYQYNQNKIREKGILSKDDKTICQIDYIYDNKGNLSKEFWNFNNNWNQTFHYIYERKDLNKNYYSSPFLTNTGAYRISKEDYTFNNEVGGPSHYFYNEKGLLIKKVFQRSDHVFTNTFYDYDDEGKLLTSTRKYSNGDTARFTYCYDENNNLVTRFYYKADTLYGFESYLYNSDGELIKAYLKNFDNWLTGTLSFDIDKFGIIKRGEFKGQNGFDASILFTYNDLGLVSEIKWVFSFGKFQQYFYQYEKIESP